MPEDTNITCYHHVCDCGAITTYLNLSDLKGLSSLKKSSLNRKLRKTAERAGAHFVNQEIKKCPGCPRAIDFSKRPDEVHTGIGEDWVIERN
jgi:hypothetical protein